MFEKEIKILEINKKKVIKKLEEFWASKTFEDIVYDVYYDYCDSKMQDCDRLFRIRQKWDCLLYTIKKKEKSDNLKVCQEQECSITDLEWFKKTLEKYWLVPMREKRKFRVSYKIDDVEFDIDEYDWIPTFMEIEASDDEIIKDWIKKLWLKNNVKKTFWSRWLFEYYKVPYIDLK